MAEQQTETFIVHVTDGDAAVFRAKWTSKNRYDPFVQCDLSDVHIPALQFGLDMQELVADGYKMGEPKIQEMHDARQREWLQIVVELEEIEPPEPVGVEYLRNLPRGTVWKVEGHGPFAICGNALVFIDSGDRFDLLDWVCAYLVLNRATAETCKPWSPE